MTTVNREFSDSTQLLEFDHNTIIDCKVKLQNIFTNELPEREIGVYGDYDILIFYRHDSRRKSNYEVKTIRKTFSEILSSADILKEDEDVGEKKIEIEEVSFKPTCQFKMRNKHHNEISYEIEVLGNIEITYASKGEVTANVDNPTAQKTQNVEKHNILPKLEGEVFQIQGDDGHSIEELMNMDLESLKKISKND